jgi:hypothetical protein
MYNVRLLLDRAGAIVERYAYDSYGRPRIRESCGRGDMNNDTKMSSGDTTRFDDANDDTIWDPRADMDDDGDVDAADETAYDLKYSDWSGAGPPVDPRQAFSDVGNPFMFQGIPHFALDTASSATEGKLMLNHHRARFADPVTGRWTTRDPLLYNRPLLRTNTALLHSLVFLWDIKARNNNDVGDSNPMYEMYGDNPTLMADPTGLINFSCNAGPGFFCVTAYLGCSSSCTNFDNVYCGPCVGGQQTCRLATTGGSGSGSGWWTGAVGAITEFR